MKQLRQNAADATGIEALLEDEDDNNDDSLRNIRGRQTPTGFGAQLLNENN